MQVPRSKSGFTVIEIVIVCVIMGVLAALSGTMFRASESRLLSNDLKQFVQQARYEAIQRNYPVAVVWNPATKSLSTTIDHASPVVASACTGSTILRTVDASEYPRASFTLGPLTTTGIVWLPSGQVRGCNGGVASELRFAISDARQSRTVVVTSTGKATVE